MDWRRMLVPTTKHPAAIPAWVKLHKLPLECWTAAGFSRIASSIGRPIHVDNATASKKRLDYARVCVEIFAGEDLPDEIVVKANGESMIIRVEYQWLPPKCTECKVFGHKCNIKPSPIPLVVEENLGDIHKEAEIASRDPEVQRKVLEALAKGGSSALDVVTKVVSPSTRMSCSTSTAGGDELPNISESVVDYTKLEVSRTIEERGLDPKPPYQSDLLITNPPSISTGSKQLVGDPEYGDDFKLVSNKKKKKGRSNQKASPPSKGR